MKKLVCYFELQSTFSNIFSTIVQFLYINVMKEIYKTRLAGIMVLRRSDWTEIHYVTGGSANRQSSLNKVSLKNLLCPFYIKNLLKKKVKIYQKYLCSFILTICSWIGPKHVDTIFLNNTYLSFGLRIKFCIFFHEL